MASETSEIPVIEWTPDMSSDLSPDRSSVLEKPCSKNPHQTIGALTSAVVLALGVALHSETAKAETQGFTWEPGEYIGNITEVKGYADVKHIQVIDAPLGVEFQGRHVSWSQQPLDAMVLATLTPTQGKNGSLKFSLGGSISTNNDNPVGNLVIGAEPTLKVDPFDPDSSVGPIIGKGSIKIMVNKEEVTKRSSADLSLYVGPKTAFFRPFIGAQFRSYGDSQITTFSEEPHLGFDASMKSGEIGKGGWVWSNKVQVGMNFMQTLGLPGSEQFTNLMYAFEVRK